MPPPVARRRDVPYGAAGRVQHRDRLAARVDVGQLRAHERGVDPAASMRRLHTDSSNSSSVIVRISTSILASLSRTSLRHPSPSNASRTTRSPGSQGGHVRLVPEDLVFEMSECRSTFARTPKLMNRLDDIGSLGPCRLATPDKPR